MVSLRVVVGVGWMDKGTYRTVRRHATSEDTPARISTRRPKPEPVPALPGPVCSSRAMMGFEVAMRSAATSCLCFAVFLALTAFSQRMRSISTGSWSTFLSEDPIPPKSGVCRSSANSPPCNLGSLILAVCFTHWSLQGSGFDAHPLTASSHPAPPPAATRLLQRHVMYDLIMSLGALSIERYTQQLAKRTGKWKYIANMQNRFLKQKPG